MDKVMIKEMFENAVHIGHRTQKWNPRMERFIFGERNGIHIINLEKTQECLEKALDFLGRCASEGKMMLFVSTKPQSLKVVEEIAKECSSPYVVSKWIPGLLTNFSTIKQRIRYLADLKDQKATGELSKYTKKEQAKLGKVIGKLEASLGGVQNVTACPDAVIVLDVVRDHIAVLEAKKLGIPVVGIVDTNSNPTEIDYPIPANDDALMSLKYLLGKVRDTVQKSRKSRV